MMISAIVAVTNNGAIGKDSDQLYYISEDLKRFKKLTVDNTVIMGRRTFDALPKGALPNRRNIVITNNTSLICQGCEVVTNIEEALQKVEGEAFIIGGEQIYKLFLPITKRIYLTEINTDRPDADKYFPIIDRDEWSVTENTEWKTDLPSGLQYRYLVLDRKI